MRKLLCGVFAASISLAGILGGAAAIGATSVQAQTPCTQFAIQHHIACDSISFYDSGVGFNGQTSVDPVPSSGPNYNGHAWNPAGTPNA